MYKKSGIIICLLLASCTTTNPNTTPTLVPSSSISPSISVTPIVTSTPIVNVSSSPEPSQTPNISPTPSATPTSITPDISDYVAINGSVYDESGALQNDVKISIKSLDSDINFSGETTTINGIYVFRNAPVGVRLEISVFKNDTWTKKTQTYISKSNLSGDPRSNIIDFGDNIPIGSPSKTNFFFISNAPEVNSLSPDTNVTLSNTDFKFKMTFSEPVDKSSVENNLTIRAVSNNFSGDTIIGDGTNGTANTDITNPVVIDKYDSKRKFSWDATGNYGKEVTVSIDGGLSSNTSNIAKYGVSLRGDQSSVQLKDAQGNSGLESGEFFINTNRRKNIIYNVDRDKVQPYLESIKLDKYPNYSLIILNFSENMAFDSLSNSNVRDLSNYTFYKNDNVITLVNPTVSVGTRSIDIKSDVNTFNAGDRIKVEVDPNLKDPAGNFFSQGVTSGELDNIKEKEYKP